MGILRDYLSYAKGKFASPKLSEEAGALLVDKHIRLRWVLPAALLLFGSSKRVQITLLSRAQHKPLKWSI